MVKVLVATIVVLVIILGILIDRLLNLKNHLKTSENENINYRRDLFDVKEDRDFLIQDNMDLRKKVEIFRNHNKKLNLKIVNLKRENKKNENKD